MNAVLCSLPLFDHSQTHTGIDETRNALLKTSILFREAGGNKTLLQSINP